MYRWMTLAVVVALAAICAKHAGAEGATDLEARFNYLSQHGNVQCSVQFENSIKTMPSDAKLEGSCCAPMDEARYRQQLDGLKKYSDIAEVPPDPYDIPAPLSERLIGYYDMALNNGEQAAYDYAMRHSDMEGPCCCKCWRWKVYGTPAEAKVTKAAVHTGTAPKGCKRATCASTTSRRLAGAPACAWA